MIPIKRQRERLRYLRITLLVAPILTGGAIAQELPSMDKMPWVGYFSGHVRRGFEFAVNNEGVCDIYLIGKDRKRVGATRTIKIYPQIIMTMPNGRTQVKSLKQSGSLETSQKPGLKHEKLSYTAQISGNATVEIDLEYDGNSILMGGTILDRGDLKEGDLSFAWRVKVPAMYTDTYDGDAKKTKERMRSDRIRFVRAKDRKKVSLKSYEDVDLSSAKMAQGGVTELSVSMDGQERRTFHFCTQGGKGVLLFQNKAEKTKGKLWKGYQVVWIRPLDGQKSPPLEIKVK